MKSIKWPKHSILIIAIVVMWLQTYLTYKASFDLDIENFMQEIILFISPISFLLFIFGISLFFKSYKTRNRFIVTVSVILSILLYGNVVFYRFYSDFITVPVLFQTSNFGDLGNSVTTLINFVDIFYFTGLILILLAIKYVPNAKMPNTIRPNMRRTYFVLSFAILFLNLGLAETERPQLLTRSFDREVLVKNLGTYNYHLYDIFVQSKSHAQRTMADGSELTDVLNFVKSTPNEPNKETYGLAEKRNVIIISLESTQNFVINNKMNGTTITPFLNSLTKDEDTLYFDNFYHQTGLGKTSDSEFIVENSMFGAGGGAVFFTNAGNTFSSMSDRLNDEGYATSVLHANNKSFWNRDLMYQALNITKFYDVESYDVTEENSANWGLKDIPFMEQSVDIMKEMEQPFYTRMLTLSNHFPFTSDEEDKFIPEYDSGDKTVDRYFQTVNYTDKAIELLFKDLKEQGLYENSMIVMYGDHYGISENHNDAMAKYLDKETITPYDTVNLQKVPFFIHIPNSGVAKEHTNASTKVHEVAGQLNVRPTLLHLLGVDTSKDVQFGTDILSKDYNGLVTFRDGRFITEDVIYANETFYDKDTGEIIEDSTEFEPLVQQAREKLELSDKVINGDLLRFYDNKTGIVSE